MSYIYKNAVLTLAADTAKDTEGGILVPRVKSSRSVALPCASTSWNVQGSIHIRPALSSYPAGPLQDRGWTLQEDILSPRTLFFSKDQLLWQCHTIHSTEADPTPKFRQSFRGFNLDRHLKRLVVDNFLTGKTGP
jgi:hypothetical protein